MHKFLLLMSVATSLILGACNKDDDNKSEPEPGPAELNQQTMNVVTGMRNPIGVYLDVVGIAGREIYRFSPTEKAYTADLLGGNSSTLNKNAFYIVNPWKENYKIIDQLKQLLQDANKSTLVTSAQKNGYTGFAKTVIAYELLLNLNMTDVNGLRINLSNNNSPAPVLPKAAALDTIARLLDEGKTALTGAEVLFPLSAGFVGFDDAAGLLKWNRAIAARVALYQNLWDKALTCLDESFLDLNGNLNTGVYYSFAIDNVSNPCYKPQNQTGDVRLAHPSYAKNITPGDDRISKATLRTAVDSSDGLASDRDVWVYPSPTSAIPIIRNEELILIYAEAKLQTGYSANTIVAINKIRTSHNLPPYAGIVSKAGLTDELLRQRQHSLFYEGHRWIDVRRYNRLNELPLDRPGDVVWPAFPVPDL